MLSEFQNLCCPLLETFEILTAAEAPIDVLFNLSQVNHNPDFLEMTTRALLFGKELKGDQR